MDVRTEGKSVLIIEDEEHFRSYLERLVGKKHRALSAGSWSEARSLLFENRVDVVLVDLRLPEMSGREIVQNLRREFGEGICIVVITGYDQEWNESQALMSGVSCYLRKGAFLPEELLSMIDTCRREEQGAAALAGRQPMLTKLADFTNRLVSMDSLNEVLHEVISTIKDVTGCTRISVMLLSDDGNYLYIKKAIGIDQNIIKSTRIGVGEHISGKAFRDRRIISSGNLNRFCNRYFQYRDRGPFMSIPLLEVPFSSGKKPIGVINLTNKTGGRAFTSQEKSLLIHIANAASIAVENALRKEALEKASIDTLILLTNVLEARDRYTRGHAVRVSSFACEIASRLGFSDQELEEIKYGAQLHDIGKIQVPDAVLLKEGRLTDDEYAVMKQHPVTSMKLVDHIAFFHSIKGLFLHHHERYDGRGYPDGIGGEDIEIGARIIAVADAFDAMTSNRPYRNAMSRDQAIQVLRSERGLQFDPLCVEAFLEYTSGGLFPQA
jgi:response regulator RpfG family c-di-GMP phosphodiesterase